MSEYPADYSDTLASQDYEFERHGWTVRYAPNSRTAHIVRDDPEFLGGDRAICNTVAWLGTGTMNERDKARTLPLCKKCRIRAMDYATIGPYMGRVPR